MSDLWVSVSGAKALQEKVETIANNVANANTAGFKKDQLAFKEQLTALSRQLDEVDLPRKEWRPEDFYRSYGQEHSKVKVDGTYTDFSQGQLTPTGNPLDVAINGKGFFEILAPGGIRYTRRGNFTLSRDGKLVNEQGYPVLAKFDKSSLIKDAGTIEDPDRRTIDITPGKVNINLKGEVSVGGNQIGELSIVEFKDIHALKKEGSLQFINVEKDNIVIEEVESSIHQGFMENSNVNALAEMSQLIEANRHFESIQRAIKTYDKISGMGANDISKL